MQESFPLTQKPFLLHPYLICTITFFISAKLCHGTNHSRRHRQSRTKKVKNPETSPVLFLRRWLEPAGRVQNLLLGVLGGVAVERGHDQRVLPAILVLRHPQQEGPRQPEPGEELLKVPVRRVDVDGRDDDDGREEEADEGEGDGGAARAAAAAAAGGAAATPGALLAHGGARVEWVDWGSGNGAAPVFSVGDQEESKE